MILDRRISRVRIMIGSDDAAHIGHVRHAGKLLDLTPVFAAIFGYLEQAIVSADVDQSILLRRLGERRGVSKEGRRSILRDSIHTPNPSHDRQLVAIESA